MNISQSIQSISQSAIHVQAALAGHQYQILGGQAQSAAHPSESLTTETQLEPSISTAPVDRTNSYGGGYEPLEFNQRKNRYKAWNSTSTDSSRSNSSERE